MVLVLLVLFAGAFIGMATYLGSQGRVAAFPQPVQTIPAEAQALVSKASSAFAAGKTAEALALAEQALALEAAYAEAHRILAQSAARLGDIGKAKHAWRVVLHLLPGDVEAQQAIKRME
jgi:cytochrome c-type biogenesis protein CcmH/NrfG